MKTAGRVTAKDVQDFADKARFVRDVEGKHVTGLWSVSTNAFDRKATHLAKKLDVYLSRYADLRKIDRLLSDRDR